MAKFRFSEWWRLDEAAERDSADNPLAPLGPEQRRPAGPLLALAFGWGFLITGLLAGGALGSGVMLWPDLFWYSMLGNAINFGIGAMVGYIAYRTGCNSALIFRATYGALGAYMPVILIALLTIGWQGIVVGAFAQVWTQSPGTALYFAVAIFGGLLFTFTTYFGVKGLERVGVPAMAVLVAVGIYAIVLNLDEAGGLAALLEQSAARAAANPISGFDAVNIVVGAWIVGAVVMAEYVRFARTLAVALAIPFVVLVVNQVFLHTIGALGAIASGSPDFTVYMASLAGFAAVFGLLGMTVALWTTGDANLYLPSVQTASLFKRPKRVMVVICGVLGTILGLGIYQQFLGWIDLLATIVPPIVGPVLAEYYLLRRRPLRFEPDARHSINVSAIAAFVGGALIAAANGKDWSPINLEMAPALLGLLASLALYLALRPLEIRLRPGPSEPLAVDDAGR
ncbi:MAG: cytosine permease [Gammaproteobacteria bacterium]|nr:cytosine permease [Gammaproteobacteria bacterium]